MRDAVIVDAVRTASGKGKQGGQLSTVHPADLLSFVISALVRRTGIDPELIDDVIAGCVSQSGEQALNIARTAALAAGLPESVPATTIDRQCGSSQQAAHFAAQGVMAGAYDIVIACGVESMSRVPMFSNLQGADPQGDGLRRRYSESLVNQGISAELLAARYGFSRSELDDFSARSHVLAAEADACGHFASEVVPVPIAGGLFAAHDETVRPATSADGLSALRPSFRDPDIEARFPDIGWVITPGNSSPLADGASGVLIMSAELAQSLGLRARARFHSFAVVGSNPITMLDGVVPATRKVLNKGGLRMDDLDAYEVNEAFAPVPMLWQQEMAADPDKLNPRGGAIALGHPLGASGTRLLTTLLHHLEATGGRFGLQTMCEGAGMANATIIERL